MSLLNLNAFPLCLFLQIYCVLFSAASSDSNILAGLEWGSMETYIKTMGYVFHLEEDVFVPGNIVYADGSTLMTTNGKSTNLIVGSNNGYEEGIAAQAQFRYIQGFLQTNSSHVLLADTGNSCIRFVSRITNLTSTIFGICTSGGFKDGQFKNALFNSPFAFARNPIYLNSVVVADYYNSALRSVDLVTGDVRTVVKDLPSNPQGITFDSKAESVFIVFPNFLGRFSLKTSTFTEVTLSANSGGLDGSFRTASFGDAERILCMNDFCLVADWLYNKIRVLDFNNQTVSSICGGTQKSSDGTIRNCSLNHPWSLLFRSDTLYIGETRAIRRIKVRKAYPCEDISATINAGEELKCVDMLPGYDLCLPLGVSQVNIREKNCKITINITKEEVKKTCPQDIFGIGNSQTLKANVILPDGDEITLPVGKYIYRRRLSKNTTCEIAVHVSDPSLKMRLDISAQYKLSCSLFSDFKELTQSVAQTRYSHVRQLTSTLCNKSADHDITLSCVNDVLQVVWPTDCLFDSGMNKQKERTTETFYQNLQKNKETVLDLLFPNHKPPIVLPSLNKEGLPASLLLTPVCSGGLKYMANSETCQ